LDKCILSKDKTTNPLIRKQLNCNCNYDGFILQETAMQHR